MIRARRWRSRAKLDSGLCLEIYVRNRAESREEKRNLDKDAFKGVEDTTKTGTRTRLNSTAGTTTAWRKVRSVGKGKSRVGVGERSNGGGWCGGGWCWGG